MEGNVVVGVGMVDGGGVGRRRERLRFDSKAAFRRGGQA